MYGKLSPHLLLGYPPDNGEEYYTSENAANASLTEEGQVELCFIIYIYI